MLLEAWLIWLVPLLASFVAFALGKKGEKAPWALSVGVTSFSTLMAVLLLVKLATGEIKAPYQESIPWIVGAGARIEFGVLVDPFSVFMALMVSFVSTMIFIYALGYMHGEEDIGRYWFWKNFFVGSMLLLVLANNFLILMMAWEMVGLCSWALISFWYKRTGPSPDPRFRTEGEYNAHCGFKALVTTSFADAFTLVAIAMIGVATAATGHVTFNFIELSENTEWLFKLKEMGLLPIFAVLLISGSLGKSAQFPYHEWLPEAMAGPTTVSALIHAATMVKAGAYFVGRMFLIVEHASATGHAIPAEFRIFFWVAVICGIVTAFLAGLYGIVAKELKKVLAFSTISQLSYIFIAFGIAGIFGSEEAFVAGAAHIAAHSVFKALLFLDAGAVIHATHTKYLHEMGGLRTKMPVTFWTMTIGGVALMGLLPTAGYFSKEMILHSAFMMPTYFWLILIITFVFTAIYTSRMLALVFFVEESEHVKKLEEHHPIHDPPAVMKVSLIVLATLVFLVGFTFPVMERFLVGNEFAVEVSSIAEYVIHTVTSVGTLISFAVIVAGVAPVYYVYIAKRIPPERLTQGAVAGTIYKMLLERWILNPVYYAVASGVRKSVSAFLAFDNAILATYRGIVRGAVAFARSARRIQTGQSQINVTLMLLAFIVFATLIISFGVFITPIA